MLQDEDVLAAVNVKIDYLMSGSSLAEHGYNLIDVNRYELCAQHSVPQAEWWKFTSCMYSMQSCLSYNTTAVNQTCTGAESGIDDDATISGLDEVSADCECSLTGVAKECAESYITSSNFETLTECVHSDVGVELADKSKAIAEAANSGSPEWIKVDNITITDMTNEAASIESWAQTVFSATCNRIEYLGGTVPDSCSAVMLNSIKQSGTSTVH